MATVRIQFPENDTPTVINLTGSRVSVGRLPHNTIQIIDRTISALHAEFVREGDHYRLHDRGSSNGTLVNGEAVTDYHLREACRISFGAFECEFSPALPPVQGEDSVENLPSRGEINEVRHENAKLRSQVELLREEVETLTKAASAESGAGADTVPRTEFVRVVDELEKLKESVVRSEDEAKRLKNNLAVLQRDRANLQRAWDEAKAELLKSRLAPASIESAPALAAEEAVTDQPEAVAEKTEPSAAARPLPGPSPAAEASEPEQTPPAFKPAAKPSIQPGKPFVPPAPAAQPATVTQPQPFAPATAPKAQHGSGSGIRPFPKANPPGPASKPAVVGTVVPLSQVTHVRPTPLPPLKPVAKVPTATPAGAGPKGTQKIAVPPKH
jgi:pSer/pThr/pTyr-binding forkhead associated (FHA) protein